MLEGNPALLDNGKYRNVTIISINTPQMLHCSENIVLNPGVQEARLSLHAAHPRVFTGRKSLGESIPVF